MAEVLTQAQIDEMLRGVSAGESTSHSSTNEKKIKEYNFRAPKKFTKEQLKILDGIFEGYSRLLSSYFTSILRLYCRVSLLNIEEQKYNEFNNGLPDYVIMGITDLGFDSEELTETNMVIQLSNSLTFSMIDRLLGGRGDIDYIERDFTEIEINIAETILKNMTSLLAEPWSAYADISPKLERIETNSRVIQTIGYDETVIIVMLEVEVNEVKSFISICIPALNLDAIMQKFSGVDTKNLRRLDPNKEKERKETILSGLQDTKLNVTAVLGEINLDLHEVLTLGVNDIIPLNKGIDSNVKIRIGETYWFDGKLGIANNAKAVKIDNILQN